MKEESKDWDTTENLYIEGDNLDALKLLQESYLGKVKMIYIDPPYNTGNDFIYNDDFKQSFDEYEEESGHVDEDGNRMKVNHETDARFHSKWCSMIYSRLRLARNLLADDGVIFISIDDNEQANLVKICNELIGEENFVCQFVWKSKPQGGNDNPHIVPEHEYVLCFAKSIQQLSTNGRPLSGDNKYKNKDEFYSSRGAYFLGKLDLSTLGYRENLDYAITAPDGTDIFPGGVTRDEQEERKKNNTNHTNDWQWRWSKERFAAAKRNGFIEFKQKKNGKWTVYAKEYEKVDRDGNQIKREIKYRTIIDDVTTVDGTTEIRTILGNRIFSFPKPTRLLEKFIEIGCNDNTIAMDFFSGAGSFAHAVMDYTAKSGKHISWITVQVGEKTPDISEAQKAGYKNICEIGKERIRRAGAKILAEHPEAKNLDTGFRVLRVDSSNMKDVYYRADEVTQASLLDAVDNVKEDRSALDLLFGCLVDWGVPLSLPYAEETIAGVPVLNYNDGDLIACFAAAVPEAAVRAIAERQPLRAVFRDSSFADSPARINVEEIFRLLSPDTELRVL